MALTRYPQLSQVIDSIPGHTAVLLKTAPYDRRVGSPVFAAVCSCMSPAQAAHCGSNPRGRAALTGILHLKYAA